VRAYKRLEEENQILRGKGGPNLIAQSAAMRPVLEIVSRVGPSDANVLITGENGTGKGVIAQALHAVSTRSGKPFISVNMGGLPEGVFESELFGHVRGAFTDAKSDRAGRFELADGGTLFMDEIGNIPMSQQAKILRTLETGDFERVGSSRTYRANVRLISATNADLQVEVGGERFRQDLLFRLNTIHIHLPPLRERREDIELLAQHFLKQHVARYRKAITGFDESATEAMRNYNWPGNVRELDHSVERGVFMTSGKVVRGVDLGLNAGQSAPRLEDMSLEEVESFLIRKTLARCDGNARRAAEELGLSRSAFYRRSGEIRSLTRLPRLHALRSVLHAMHPALELARRPAPCPSRPAVSPTIRTCSCTPCWRGCRAWSCPWPTSGAAIRRPRSNGRSPC
jgi:DNA-binding NtrC family response regulator